MEYKNFDMTQDRTFMNLIIANPNELNITDSKLYLYIKCVLDLIEKDYRIQIIAICQIKQYSRFVFNFYPETDITKMTDYWNALAFILYRIPLLYNKLYNLLRGCKFKFSLGYSMPLEELDMQFTPMDQLTFGVPLEKSEFDTLHELFI